MISEKLVLSKYPSSRQSLLTVSIKYGDQFFHFNTDQIAYLYKVEGIFFLVDTTSLKLPLFITSVTDFPLDLTTNEFFHLSEEVVVRRSAVALDYANESLYVIASNSQYHNTFEVPTPLQGAFITWLNKQSNL